MLRIHNVTAVNADHVHPRLTCGQLVSRSGHCWINSAVFFGVNAVATANATIALPQRDQAQDPFGDRWSVPQAVMFITASSTALWLAILWVLRAVLG